MVHATYKNGDLDVIWRMVYSWFTHIGWFEISLPFNFLAFAIAATIPGDDWLRNAVGQIPNLSLGLVGMARNLLFSGLEMELSCVLGIKKICIPQNDNTLTLYLRSY